MYICRRSCIYVHVCVSERLCVCVCRVSFSYKFLAQTQFCAILNMCLHILKIPNVGV